MSTTLTNLEEEWTAEETATALRVPIKTLYRWNSQGTGPKRRKRGRRVFYRPSDVIAFRDAGVVD